MASESLSTACLAPEMSLPWNGQQLGPQDSRPSWGTRVCGQRRPQRRAGQAGLHKDSCRLPAFTSLVPRCC